MKLKCHRLQQQQPPSLTSSRTSLTLLFMSARISRLIFWHPKQVLLPGTLEAFLCSSIFSKAVFCLGEEQGRLVNNEFGSWYNGGGDFCCWFVIKVGRFYNDSGPACETGWKNPIPEYKANGTGCRQLTMLIVLQASIYQMGARL